MNNETALSACLAAALMLVLVMTWLYIMAGRENAALRSQLPANEYRPGAAAVPSFDQHAEQATRILAPLGRPVDAPNVASLREHAARTSGRQHIRLTGTTVTRRPGSHR